MDKNLTTFTGLAEIVEFLRKSKRPQVVVEKVPVAALVRLQSRAPETLRPVAEYAEAKRQGDVFPHPAAMIDPATATAYLVDGNTRIEADELNGHDTVTVKFSLGSPVEAVIAAARANDAHGLRPSNADKRARGLMVLSTPGLAGFSSNYLAKLAGISPQIIEELRIQLDADAKARGLPPATPERRTVKRGGQVYTTKRNAEGKAAADPLQRIVDRVVKAAKDLEAEKRLTLVERLTVALQTPAAADA